MGPEIVAQLTKLENHLRIDRDPKDCVETAKGLPGIMKAANRAHVAALDGLRDFLTSTSPCGTASVSWESEGVPSSQSLPVPCPDLTAENLLMEACDVLIQLAPSVNPPAPCAPHTAQGQLMKTRSSSLKRKRKADETTTGQEPEESEACKKYRHARACIEHLRITTMVGTGCCTMTL